MSGPSARAKRASGRTEDADRPTAGNYLAAKLRALDDRLGEVAPRVLASGRNEDAVHDLRVALRRTRTVLEVGRSLFGRFHSDEVRALLRDVQRATGALRDEEVLLDLLASVPVSDPGVQAWLTTRRVRERRLRRALARLIEAGELERARRLLDALLAFRVDPAKDRRLAKFARRAVAGARRRVERRRNARIDDPRALHRLRIGHKRLRYIAEAFAESLPGQVTALVHSASRAQNRLGRIHDVDIAVASVRRARALSPDARTALLSALYRLREERVAAYAGEAAPLAYAREIRPQEDGGDALRKTSTR
jgi:CHAD domain-containing protein